MATAQTFFVSRNLYPGTASWAKFSQSFQIRFLVSEFGEHLRGLKKTYRKQRARVQPCRNCLRA